MNMQKLIRSMTGYKGTDKDMRCQGFQFELGRWYEMPEGDLVLCSRGFHFCKYPSRCRGGNLLRLGVQNE